MDDFKKIIDDMLNIENIDEIHFKKIEINPNKIIYFIIHENQKIMNGRFTSGSVEPEAFILKMGDKYYYCPLNDKEFDEKLIKEFTKNL